MQNFPSKHSKSVGARGSAPDPTGGAYDAPLDPLIGFARPLRALKSCASRTHIFMCFMPKDPTMHPPIITFVLKTHCQTVAYTLKIWWRRHSGQTPCEGDLPSNTDEKEVKNEKWSR